MGDDPIIPGINVEAVSGTGGSAATGGSSYSWHYGLSKDGTLWVVLMSCLSLGMSFCAVVLLLTNRAVQKDLIDAAERRMSDNVASAERRMGDKVNAAETRAMDYAYLAKQEARIALEKAQENHK
jgi:hypothetical protein